MSNRFNTPSTQFFVNPATGAPLAGGKLNFYATGTNTRQNTYSDSALSVANTNPVVLDANGYSGNVFLSNLAYKVVLTDSNDVQLWTADPVSTSDYSAVAQFQVNAGNPNGTVAGTAGTGSIPSSVVWDSTNNILYVCTTTGSVSTAIWTGINSGVSSTPTIVPPQGRLCYATGVPFPTTDATTSTIYYTPYIGNSVPIYNGSSFTNQTFAEIFCTLTAAQAVSILYDLFIFNNSGVLTLVTGPAWSNSGQGVGDRGSGAGTTQLQRINGIWVNAVQITGKNGANSYTIGANLATYLGTMQNDRSSAGTVIAHMLYSQGISFDLWNAYNRVPIALIAGDSTANWVYAGAFRVSNGNSLNSIRVVTGLAEEMCVVEFRQNLAISAGSTGKIAISFDDATGTSTFALASIFGNTTAAAINATLEARCRITPVLGSYTFYCAESTTGASNSTYSGTNSNMELTVKYRA